MIAKTKNNYSLLIVLLFGVASFGLFPRKAALFILPFAFYVFFVTLNHKYYFRKYIISYLFFASLSTITCFFFRGQSFWESFTCPAFREYYFLFVYFIFCSLNPRIEYVENTILKSFYIFFVLYMIQYIVYPTSIIEIIAGETSGRFRVIGEIVNSLAYFICFNRFLMHGGVKNIIIMTCSIIVLFLLGFRAMLGAITIASLIMYIKINGFMAIKKNIIAIFTLTIIVGFLSQTGTVQKGLERMIKANEEETYSNENYIRIIQLEYYLHDHFKSNIERLFGSGQPGFNSSYGQEMLIVRGQMDRQMHIKGGFLDWGLIGQSWVCGPITILIFYLMMCKCIYISWKSDKTYTYIAGWYIFLILISFTNMEAHRTGSMIYHTLVFYVITILQNRKESIRK